MFCWLYEYGTVNFGNGDIKAKRNKITNTITITGISKSTMSQLFRKREDV